MTNITIAKTGQSIEIDFAALPANSQDFIINYGLRQILNDCHSSLTIKGWEGDKADFDKAVMEAVEEKFGAIMSGDLTIRGTGEPRIVDPVEKEVRAIARAEIETKLQGANLSARKIGKEKMAELLAAHIEKSGDRLRKDAKAAIKRREAIDVDTGDILSSLGL